MSDHSTIEWTDATWNPVRGCSRVSPGCEHCYAEGVAARFSGPGQPYEGLARRAPNGEPRWTGTVRLVPEMLDQPLRWKRPRRIFTNSMSDLFHESLSFEEIAAVYAVMHACPLHTFQVLTKRPARRLEFMRWLQERGGIGPYIRSMTVARKDEPEVSRLRRPFDEITKTEVINGRKCRARDDAWMQVFNAAAVTHKGPAWNIWEGVSVENQAAADERIPHLLQTPAAVRFLSVEPLLGPVDLSRWAPALTPWQGAAPATWSDVAWPAWVPPELRAEIATFWSEAWHRGPKAYAAQFATNYARRVGFGERVSGRDLGKKPIAGRYVHAWNNIGRVVRDDGSYGCVAAEVVTPDDRPARLDWVIVGGESGTKARPMHPQWARDLRDQCVAAGVAFFFKQWGEWREFDHGSPDVEVEEPSDEADSLLACAVNPGFVTRDGRFFRRRSELPDDETPCRMMEKVGKKRAGRELDGRTWDEFPAGGDSGFPQSSTKRGPLDDATSRGPRATQCDDRSRSQSSMP